MSEHRPITKDDIQAQIAAVMAEDEYLDRLGRLPEVEAEAFAEAVAGRAALMRSAGVVDEIEVVRRAQEGAESVADRRLSRFVSDFLTCAYQTMRVMRVPEQARDFVLIVMAASGGTPRRLIITDERLAELSGYTDRTIRAKRKAYKEWLDSEKGWTIVRLCEKPFASEAGKNPPNEYEFLFGPTVLAVLREWRTFYQTHLNQPEAPDRDAEEEEGRSQLWGEMKKERESVAFAERTPAAVFEEIVERAVPDTLECEPSSKGERRSRKSEGKKGGAQRKNELEAIDAQILKLIAKGRDAARRQGFGAYWWWTNLKPKAAIVLAEQTPGFPDPEELDTAPV